VPCRTTPKALRTAATARQPDSLMLQHGADATNGAQTILLVCATRMMRPLHAPPVRHTVGCAPRISSTTAACQRLSQERVTSLGPRSAHERWRTRSWTSRGIARCSANQGIGLARPVRVSRADLEARRQRRRRVRAGDIVLSYRSDCDGPRHWSWGPTAVARRPVDDLGRE